MKITGKFVFVTLILTALLSSVSASPAEISIFPEQSSTEINSFTSYEVTVTNTGPVADVYHLSSSSNEVTIAPRRVPEQSGQVLEPGQSETVNLWYNPGPRTDAGLYSFSVTARSQSTDNTYSAEGQVEVIANHEVDVEVVESMTGCLGENVVYKVDVTNDGIQQEKFKLTTKMGEISQNKVTLAPNETTTVDVTVSSGKPTQETFNIIAASPTSYAQDIESTQFNAERCYASDVSITPQNQEAAAFTDAEYDVTVRNTGTKADEFVLSSNVGEFEDNQFEVEGKSSQTTTLTVTPEKLGQQQIEVTAKSRVTSSATANLNVVNGMDADVSFEEDTTRVCESETFELTAEIENTGNADETYNLQTSVGNLSEPQVEVDAGESEDVTVELNSAQLSQGRHTVNLTATAATFGEPVRTSGTSVVVENCWDLSLNVVPNVMSAGENRSVIYEVQLTNNGTRENTYELSTDGPEWVSIKPDELTVSAGGSDKAFVFAGIPFRKKGEVEITAIAQGNQIKKSETVRLLIGKEIEDAVKSDEDNAPTGGFSSRLPSARVDLGSNAGKLAASIIIGLLITAGVLYREW